MTSFKKRNIWKKDTFQKKCDLVVIPDFPGEFCKNFCPNLIMTNTKAMKKINQICQIILYFMCPDFVKIHFVSLLFQCYFLLLTFDATTFLYQFIKFWFF